MAKLILIAGAQRTEYELDETISVGRHPDNTIQLLDPVLSKEHARIEMLPDGQFIVRDLGSLNGTYIAGKRISEHILANGDEIALGSTRLQFLDQPSTDTMKVMISRESTESQIRRSIAAEAAHEFLPEKKIADDKLLRGDYERLRVGYELSQALAAELDLNKLLPKILEKAFELLRADRGVVLLMDDHGQLQPRYVKQKEGDENIVLSRTVMREVVKNKTAVLSADASMDSRFSAAQSIVMQGIRSTMTVPLLFGDELLGIMHLDSKIATGAFGEKDLQIFTGIAGQAAIAIQNARLAKRIEKDAQTRAQFERLIPPNVVDQVVSGELSIEKGGKLHEVTMLYSDIRGFTAMSERKAPREVVVMLNEYFEVMVDVLFRWEGTLDKFVGDEIIGLFGAPIDLPDAPFKAVACALDMQKALREFNRTRAAENLEPIKIGIGVNTGPVVTGAIGSSKALQYTAIGDAMNTASRLCSAAKAGQLIISESTMQKVAARVHAVDLPSIQVKGKTDPLRIFNIVGLRETARRTAVQ